MSPDPLAARIAPIRLAVFDVDGVLTDGALHYGPEGEVVKIFHTLDGHGLKMLRASGITLAIISGRSSPALARRAADLGITHLYMGIENKRATFEHLLNQLGLSAQQAAGLGDDVVDLPFLLHCGFAACVPAAPAFVQQRVHYVTRAAGGAGAVREFCELMMQHQGTLDAALQRYLN